MIKRSTGLEIPFFHNEYHNIKSILTRKLLNKDSEKMEKVTYYEEFDDYILIPRFYPVKDEIDDCSIDGDDIVIESTIIPRSEGQNNAINKIVNSNNGIISLETGRGKSIVAIAAIAKIKKKAIIIVHKKGLVKNWKKEILEHTSLSDDDISVLSSTKLKKKLEKSIVLCTPQTLISLIRRDKHEFMDEVRQANFGIAFFDECHASIGSPEFTRASYLISAKRVFGLSATPERQFDDTTDIIEYHLGNEQIYFEPEVGEILKPDIYQYRFPFGVCSDRKKYFVMTHKFEGNNAIPIKFDVLKYYSMIHNSEVLINKVIEVIKKAYDGKRNIVIMATRTNILFKLAEKLGMPKSEIGMFTPTVDKSKIKKVSDELNPYDAFLTKRIVFTTYGACRDGNNRPDLDCLILLNGTSNITQAVGRVLRSKEGKRNPLVFQFVDTEGPRGYSTDPDNKDSRFVAQANAQINEIFKPKEWPYKILELNKRK